MCVRDDATHMMTGGTSMSMTHHDHMWARLIRYYPYQNSWALVGTGSMTSRFLCKRTINKRREMTLAKIINAVIPHAIKIFERHRWPISYVLWIEYSQSLRRQTRLGLCHYGQDDDSDSSSSLGIFISMERTWLPLSNLSELPGIPL